MPLKEIEQKRKKYPRIKPENEPIKNVLKFILVILSSNERKLIIDTDIIIPGIAYPEIDKFEMKFKNLFFNTLFPKFVTKESVININAVIVIRKKVFKLSLKIFRLLKYSGYLNDQ